MTAKRDVVQRVLAATKYPFLKVNAPQSAKALRRA